MSGCTCGPALGTDRGTHEPDPVAAHARVVVEKHALKERLVEDDFLAQLGAMLRVERQAANERGDQVRLPTW